MAYLYNPEEAGDIEKLKERYSEFKAELPDADKWVKYVVYMYDINSPFRTQETNFEHRKAAAAIKAGFPLGKATNKFTEEVEGVLWGDNKLVNAMMIRYCSVCANTDYLMLQTYCDMLAKAAFESMNSRVAKSGFIDNQKKLSTEINRLTEGLFGGGEAREIRDALYKDLEEKRIGLSPEDVIEKVENGEDPLDGFNPHGSSHNPKVKLKYAGSKSES